MPEVALSAVAAEESVTFTVMVVVLGVVTVPENAPALLSVTPVGNVPLATDQESVPVPPVAASVAL